MLQHNAVTPTLAESSARGRFVQRYGPEVLRLRRCGLSKADIARHLRINDEVVAQILSAASTQAQPLVPATVPHGADDKAPQADSPPAYVPVRTPTPEQRERKARKARAKRTRALRQLAEADAELAALPQLRPCDPALAAALWP